jgi:hypothetical protein
MRPKDEILNADDSFQHKVVEVLCDIRDAICFAVTNDDEEPEAPETPEVPATPEVASEVGVALPTEPAGS